MTVLPEIFVSGGIEHRNAETHGGKKTGCGAL